MPSWLEQQTDSLATIDGVQRHRTTNITPENIFVYFCSERSEAYFCIKKSRNVTHWRLWIGHLSGDAKTKYGISTKYIHELTKIDTLLT